MHPEWMQTAPTLEDIRKYMDEEDE